MADDTLGAFFVHADALAQRVRERFDYQLKLEIEQRERTIDIQIDKASDEKANRLATQKLKRMQAWAEASEQLKANVFWVCQWLTYGNSGILFFLSGLFIFSGLGFLGGINTPTSIVCKNSKSLCYLLRMDKTQVVLPEQTKQLIEEYERLKVKPRRSRRK